MKVKVLKFQVSNASSQLLKGDEKERWAQNAKDMLDTPSKIENTINDFCCDKNIIDIKVNTVDVNYHNNARGNTIELWYTILYED